MKIRIQELHIVSENESVGGRPQRSREDSRKKKGRIYTDEEDFPIKKKDSHIGLNKRERNRR